VNTVIGLILEEGEDKSALDGYSPKATPSAAPAAKPAAPAAPQAAPAPQQAVAATGGRIIASPLAKRIAAERGVNLASVQGSGPRGRIIKADVIGAPAGASVAAPMASSVSVPSTPVVAAGPGTDTLNSTMRKTIARRLVEAKQNIPHFYLTIDCNVDNLMEMRKRLNDAAESGEYKISVNDIVIKAAALALKQVPAANASWMGDFIRVYEDVDISVAVATPGGLITPVIRHADTKGIAEVSNEVKELAGRAREGKLMPEEYTGGGFTISNLGMFGIREFAAIINPPQSCILAVGVGEQRPVVKHGALAIATMMTCTLSVDHRAVDGALGAEYMAAFKKIIEEPMKLML
ncbi:MAG: 2-oxo acid dehydrogenase subunit E2, partial [Rhodospirillaceae bacterium]|nr:2-oxo acid dehydrogenase subunit E2 [Rhodospirillaceae bacterium]